MIKFIFIYTKIILKKIIFLLKVLLKRDKLDQNELKGSCLQKTNLKFIKKTPLEVPFDLGRSARGISFKENLIIKDPLFRVLKNIYMKKSFLEIRDDFFQAIKHESELTIAEITGIKSNKKLSKYPSWATVLPWENIDIVEKYKTYEKIQILTRKEKASEYNFQHINSSSNYINSIEMAESHVLQSQNLFESIAKNGYNKKLGIPSFHILIKDNEWRWYMSQGNHRVYIIYLLKNKFLYGTIDSIIKKRDSMKWPNVMNGTFEVTEAEKLFDKIFEGEQCIKPSI